MKIERDARGGGPIVTGFGAAGFKIGGVGEGVSYPALLMTVDAALPWSPPAFEALAIADLQPLIDTAPEFILLGTGATLRQPPPGLRRALDAAGLGVEAMDSRAAARAWGVLRGEGRRIAAALYPLG